MACEATGLWGDLLCRQSSRDSWAWGTQRDGMGEPALDTAVSSEAYLI